MLCSITLQGFKSFADRTQLEFGPGISAIVGPNGSGKSNVVEALRWVTHQARARELRAGRAAELIFHGSGKKAPLGLAEVQIELKTDSIRLNLARRLYRDGTSEQDLGGCGTRIRDIQSALRDTGLGPGGLAVIGQGEVSSVVQAEGNTLLGYVQEAAGLSRAVSARHETELQLRSADVHLEQLRLMQSERAAQVESLSKAAQAFCRHRKLTLRSLTLEDALKRERQAALYQEILQARAEVNTLEVRSQVLAAEVQAAAEAAEAAREAVSVARARADAFASALDTLRAARDAHEQAQRYYHHLQREAERLHAENSALSSSPPTEAEPDIGALDTALAAASAETAVAERCVFALESKLAHAREVTSSVAEAAARALASRQTLDAELKHAEENLARTLGVLVTAREEYSAAAAARTEVEADYIALRAQRDGAAVQKQHISAQLDQLSASITLLQREQDRLKRSLDSYTRYGEGARNALLLEHTGIVGSVADLIRVPAEYEAAVMAALGRRLEHIVVHTSEDAREIINEVRRLGGRATFLPLDLIRARPRRGDALMREAGVVGNLADLCPTDPPTIGEVVLAGTLLVQDLWVASRIARAHTSRPRLVTLEGELLEIGGAITGGRLIDAGFSVLADQRRFGELGAELEEAEQRSSWLSKELSQIQVDLVDGAVHYEALLVRQKAATAKEQAAEKRVTELDAQARSLESHRGSLLARVLIEQPPASGALAETELTKLETDFLAARERLELCRKQERVVLDALIKARELAAAWQSFRAASVRAAELQTQIETNAAALQVQKAHLSAAANEVIRREVVPTDKHELSYAEKAKSAAAQAYTSLIGEQNITRRRLEDIRLKVARREGSLEPLPDGCSPPGAPREWTAELSGISAQLSSLGPVNARAEIDYGIQSSELEGLTAQIRDAQAAAAELRAHLTLLEAAEVQSTRVAVKNVGAAFCEYASELLGKGELIPEHSEIGQLTGLRLAVQPRGKRTRAMTLLSTGERTMVGLAFLFALNHAKEGSIGGLPLAVLDEVDAPLDEANIRRFTAFLERFSERGSQFILITHQKATMEVAHALWGVTTDESGASRVLSIRQIQEAAYTG